MFGETVTRYVHMCVLHMAASKKTGPFGAGTRSKAEPPTKIRSRIQNSYDCTGLRPVEMQENDNRDLIFIGVSDFVRVPAQNGPDFLEIVIALLMPYYCPILPDTLKL